MEVSATRRTALAGLGASVIAAPAFARTRHNAQVIVIGAGISGLETALRLEAAGVDVLVLEATGRIGGRLKTWTDLPGSPNVGGVQIGASYARLRDRARALNVELFPEPTALRANRICIGDQLIDPAAWALSPQNPFPQAYKSVQPSGALFATAGRANPLVTLDDWRGAKGIATDTSADAFLAGLGFDAQARALIDIGVNANQLSSYSIVNVLRSLTLFAADRATSGGSSMIRGGSQVLPEAMARALKRPVRTDQIVRALRVDARGASVRVGQQTLRAAAVVVTAPFPALRNIAINAPMSQQTREAIAGLPYTQIVQMIIEPQTRFWETDGLPIDMWTDGPLERIFSIRDSTGSDTGQLMLWLNGTGATALDAPLQTLNRAGFMSQIAQQAAFGAISPATQAYSNAAQGPLDADDPRTLIRTRLKALRSASEGSMRIVRTQHWTASNPFAGGAYMHWAPGQIGRWAGKMGRPAGRLFFAGEHLGLVHTGMEAAFESSEQAVGDVLAAIGNSRMGAS